MPCTVHTTHLQIVWLCCYRQKHTINRLQQECREYEARLKQLLLNRSLEEAGVIGIRLQVSYTHACVLGTVYCVHACICGCAYVHVLNCVYLDVSNRNIY